MQPTSPRFCAKCGAAVGRPYDADRDAGGFLCAACAKATGRPGAGADRAAGGRAAVWAALLALAVGVVVALVYAGRHVATGREGARVAEKSSVAMPPVERRTAEDPFAATPPATSAVPKMPADVARPGRLDPAVVAARAVASSADRYFTFDADSIDWSAAPPVARDLNLARPAAVLKGVTAVPRGRVHGGLRIVGGRGVDLPDSGQDNPPAQAVSVAAWVRLETGGDGTIVDKADWDGGPCRGYVLRVMGGRMDLNVGGRGWQSVATPDKLPTNRWVHVAGTYDGRTGRVYVDGELQAEGEIARMDPSPYPIRIGNGTFKEARDRPWPGSLDEVGIYHRALTAAEVRALAAGE